MLVGISSGASLAAVAKLSEIPENATDFCYDTGEHYLSVEGLLNNKLSKSTNKQETDL
jgi:cysteine synthase A